MPQAPEPDQPVAFPTALELLEAPSAEVYKCDGRSRVWRIDRCDGQGGPVVVKRFEYSPPRQLLARLLGLHPAQRELRWNRRLGRAGLPVVPIIWRGAVYGGWGCRCWLATPCVGKSLQQCMRGSELAERDERLAVLRVVAQLTCDLIRHGYYFPDLKPSNILIDKAGQAWLIDVGGVRHSRSRVRVLRMLGVMLRKTRQDRLSRTDQWRFLRMVVDQCPEVGGLKEAAASIEVWSSLARV